MKRIVSAIIFILFISFNSLIEAAIPATVIARLDEPQINHLKDWLGYSTLELDIKILDFETKEARSILSRLRLEFIPAVVFDASISSSDSEILEKKFRLVTEGKEKYIARQSLERIVTVEFYRRRLIPRHLDLFSMSLCPYSIHAERRLINYVRAHNLGIDLRIHYLVTLKHGRLSSLRGLRELNEDRRRIIIQKYWPDKFFDYLLLREDNPYRKVLRKLGIEYDRIKEKMGEADALLTQGYRLAKDLDISAAPTFLWQNKFLVTNLKQLSNLHPFNQKGRLVESVIPQGGLLKIVAFTSPKCHACHKVKEEFLPLIIEKYKGLLEVVYYDIDQPDNFNYLMELEEKYGILEQGSIPKIFVGDNVLIGLNQIQNNLENILLQALGEGRRDLPLVKVEAAKEEIIPARIIGLFKTFTLGTVLWAGLIDGVNPCAFTTLVFFLSFLSFAGYKKREVLYVGTFFIIAVFLTYFLLGLGAYKFILKLKIYSTFAEIFYWLVGILVILLGAINFYDFLRFRKTQKIEDIKLKLPAAIKWKIQSIIGKGYRKEGEDKQESASTLRLIFLSLVIGFFVSILESVCTGQVYLPTITFITKVPALRMKAVFYLFIYNLMFVVPLVVIFILAICGLTSERFSKFARRHLAKIKLATAVFFFGLFLLLWKVR